MSIINLPLPGTSRDPLYPDSDGEPMAETDFHAVGEYLRPRLRGYRLGSHGYDPLAAEAEGELRFLSRELGLFVEPEGDLLRLFEVRTMAPLLSITELQERATTAAAAVSQAEKRTGRAEQQVKSAQRRAEAESRRAEAESRRAEALEAEIKRLRGEAEGR